MKRGLSLKRAVVASLVLFGLSCGDGEPASSTSTALTAAPGEVTVTTARVDGTDAPTTSTTVPPPVEDLLFVPEAFRDRLVELVEETQMLRGLSFLDPVAIEVTTPQELTRRLRSQVEDGPDIWELSQSLLRLLGLIDEESDWVSVMAQFRSRPTPGYYDAFSQKLWLASDLQQATPLDEMTLVGEIAKALVDRNIGIWRRQERLAGAGDGDAITAMGAMAEADSMLVELLFLEGLGDAAKMEVAEQAWELSAAAVPLPSFLVGSLRFASGPTLDYLQRLYQLGGWGLIDDTHSDPPVSTEQILAQGVGQLDPILLDKPGFSPPEGYQEVADAVWGQWGWETLLSSALGPERAFSAAWGWGGDRYLVFNGGSDVILAVDYIGDTTADTEEMRVALADFIREGMAVGEGRWRDGGTEFYADDYAWLSGEGELITFIAATDVEAGRGLRASRGS